jgi:hypothetical protein
MNLIDAINAVAVGHVAISNAKKKYTCEQLKPVWYGKHYASFSSAGMTEAERKGVWRIESRK